MSEDKPYWFPVLCDESYFVRLREDYPENAHMSDEDLHDYYNDGLKYQNLWDHKGDAYGDYEPLADAFLVALEALQVVRMSAGWDHLSGETQDLIAYAIAKATGAE